ncbi:hypothetical protein HNY73_002944 [Argiope bruennichi]|uniref:Uncharacterized protein n=1 Tax=Argiope bruennichi TaxID=94029 RepID=A0A8T0FWE7_ARGBR|nr:hypothetical protein HNY73_002944 [Argiope bruennichi]
MPRKIIGRNIDATLKRFGELEEITIKNQDVTIEEFCEKHFRENYRVNDGGNCVVRSPIFNRTEELGDSKPLAISRALLLGRLFKAVTDVFSSYDISFQAWSDSKVVLSWLVDHPRRWKLFVANRTSEILDVIPYQQWIYIPSKENPADIPSRGIDSKLLQNSSLWHGPSFLKLNSSNRPLQSSISNETDNDAAVFAEQKTKSIFCTTVQLTNDTVDNLFILKQYKLSSNSQLMGSLPKQRVTLERPFRSTGIDYAGPIILKCYKGCCLRTTKGYIALFVCLATKA